MSGECPTCGALMYAEGMCADCGPQELPREAVPLTLVRALWKAFDETAELPTGWEWDDLPEPQRGNWLALAEAARSLGVCVIPPQGDPDA